MKDVAAERAVLADMYQRGENGYLDLSEIQLSVDTFSEENGKFYKIFGHLISTGVKNLDLPTVQSAAASLKIPFDRTDLDYLRGLQNYPIEPENVVKLAKKIKKLEITRLLSQQIKIIDRGLSKVTGEESVDEIIGIAEKQILDFSLLLGDDQQKTHHIADGLDDFMLQLKERKGSSVGIPTGYKNYDKAIGGGVRLGTVSLIGARPKVGKSSLTNNIGVYVAKNVGIPVLILDTEMNEEQQWARLLASLSSVDIAKIENGRFYDNEFDLHKVNAGKKVLETIPLTYRSIKGLPFEEILSVIRRWIVKDVGLVDGKANPCFIIYDYFKSMNVGDLKQFSEHQALGFQISQLADMMGKYHAACLSFTQLNREGVDLEDLRAFSASDRLSWICASISIFKPKGLGDDNQYNRKLIICDCRHGEGLEENDYINMNFTGRIGKIVEGPTRNVLSQPGNNGKSF